METSWRKCILLGFFVLMITKKLIIIIFKWCVIFFVTTILSMHKFQNSSKKVYFILQNKWYNNFQQTSECKPCRYCKTFEEEAISPLREIVWRQPTKRGLIYLVDKFQFFFVAKVLFKKDKVQQKEFMQDLCLLIVKSLFANVVYGKYLDRASFAFISSNTFSFKIFFSIGVASFGGKTKEKCVLPKLTKCNITRNFDFWMF